MEENKLCQCCGINHAARCYEDKKSGVTWFYCLECYAALFLEGGDGGEEGSYENCPYCGTDLAEVKASKIVGCAHCYRVMWEGIFPMVERMQGKEAHAGRTPPIVGNLDTSGIEKAFPAEYRAQAMQRARFERQCRELEIIIDSLKAKGLFEEAKGYAEKLAVMKNNGAIEEDFVWRTRCK